MAAVDLDFMRRLAGILAFRAGQRAIQAMRTLRVSRTLQASLRIRNGPRLQRNLHIPQYWALYVHDGRPSVTRTKPPMIWFHNPSLDPRLIAGPFGPITPERRRDVSRLSKAQFKRFRAQGHLIIARTVSSIAKKPFFSVGPGGAMSDVAEVLRKEADTRIRAHLRDTFPDLFRLHRI